MTQKIQHSVGPDSINDISMIFTILILILHSLIDILHYECMSMLDKYPSNSVHVDFIDRVQSTLECCGCMAPADYTNLQKLVLPDTCYNTEEDLHNIGCLPQFYQVSCNNNS